MQEYGTPALFVTFSPADLYNSLFGVCGGIDLRSWQHMSLHDRAVFITSHPHVAALAFDKMVSNFLDVVVRRKHEKPGLFGDCIAYFGIVEAQGRGTLHLHLLLWLKDNPNPQALRDTMEGDGDFRRNVITWLEDIIQCELPGQMHVVRESNNAPPALQEGDLDPRILDMPRIDRMSQDEFETEFERVVTELVIACNWHVHTDTCWKHLHSGEPRNDAHCRMWIDGLTRAETEIDPQTWSVLLHHLHLCINNYNACVMFLLQCNMDIKYIGSGPAAKALLFYITDYITKSSLSVHAGLDALKYALARTEQSIVDNTDEGVKEKTLFVKSVNAMMGRQELSHQQVMSYIVGGGDHYKSHAFISVNWPRLDDIVQQLEDGTVNSENEQSYVSVDAEGVHSKDLAIDYRLWPSELPFTSMSFWEYTRKVEKMTVNSEHSRLDRNAKSRSRQHNRGVLKGRPANA